jgi:hypothetical protein
MISGIPVISASTVYRVFVSTTVPTQCTGNTAPNINSDLSYGSVFAANVSAPPASGGVPFSGPAYVGLCVATIARTTNIVQSSWSFVSFSTVLILAPAARTTVSCRTSTMPARSSVTCSIFGFASDQSVVYIDRSTLSITATPTAATAGIVGAKASISFTSSDATLAPTNGAPFVPLVISMTLPFISAVVRADSKPNSVSTTITTVAPGTLVSWRPFGLQSSPTISQDLFSLMGRSAPSEFTTFSKTSSAQQSNQFSPVYAMAQGTTTGAENFVSMSCSTLVCMAVSDTGFLYSWGSNAAAVHPNVTLQSLGRSASTTYDTIGQVTEDQKGWQHLSSATPTSTPFFKSVAVNPVDHSTLALSSDGVLVVIASPNVGQFSVLPNTYFSGANIVRMTVHSAYWAVVDTSDRVWALRIKMPTIPGASTTIHSVQPNPYTYPSSSTSVPAVSQFVVVETSPTLLNSNYQPLYQFVLIQYINGVVWAGGDDTYGPCFATLFPLGYVKGTVTQLSATLISAWGLPALSASVMISKIDGYYNSAGRVGSVYALINTGEVRFCLFVTSLRVASNSACSFVVL